MIEDIADKSAYDRNTPPRFALCLAAFLIPIVVMVVAGALIGMMPFGEQGFLISDIGNQFAAFYTYFKNTISTGGSLTYSLSKTLGGGMAGFWGYYLNNPFLFLLFLFPDEIISVGIYYMLAIMLGCMSLTFYLMLADRGGDRYYYPTFAWGYALSGYCMAYLAIPGFFCSMILLPLVIMGLRRMLADAHRFVLYAISLAFAIICNYYIGYMICIFCGLYYIAGLVGASNSRRPGDDDNIASTDKHLFRRFLAFLGASLAALVLALPSLIPTVKSLSGQKTSDLGVILDRSHYYSAKSLISNLLPGRFYCDYSNAAAPYIYVGLPVLICLALYFVNKRFSLRERIVNLVFLGFMILCTYFNGLDSVWHGFNSPVGFAHRQAFLIVFLMLDLGAQGLMAIAESRKTSAEKGKWISRVAVVLPIVILLAEACELSYNTVQTMFAYNEREMQSQSEYAAFFNKNSEIIRRIQEADKGLYRIEKDYDRNHNDALMLSYAGLSHNSSCESDYIKQFAARMGLRNQGIWSMYNQGSTVFADSLLGVKYFVSRFDSTNKPYRNLFDSEGSFVFENPYALPLGWVEDSSRANAVDMEEPDLFALQNAMSGHDIYTEASVSETLNGLSVSTEAVTDEIKSEAAADAQVGIKNEGAGTLSRVPDSMKVYSKDGDEAYVEYTVSIQSDCNLYCYFTAPSQQAAEVFVNGATRDNYFSDYRWNIINCGNFLPGDEVSVQIRVPEDSLRLYNAYFYEEHIDALEEWYGEVTANPVQLSKVDDAHLVGRVSVGADIPGAPETGSLDDSAFSADADSDAAKALILSLPYEKGWKVYLDGKQVDTYMVYDCLLAVDVAPGEHELELKYGIW